MPATKTQARRPIRILPPHIVNKIAAGEVVERPASVVKELVENALDAGATRIDVFVSASGRTIRVADNGSGMDAENARLAFHNHATSKIADDADLHRIDTLGFRGEALASIAAISRLTCLTRTPDSDHGIRISFEEGGAEPVLSETGCAPGTVMEVADLFYNTPARLKFLKRPATELGHIEETVQSLALSHPDVRFTLRNQDKQALKTTGTGELQIVLEEIFRLSREGAALVPVRFGDAEAGYELTGFTSAPGLMKSSRKWLTTFVNGRTVKDPVMTKAIETAYESLLPHGKHPLAVLFLRLPTGEVDVNVHPTKKEVRYTAGNSVFSFVKTGIRESLAAHGIDLASPSVAPQPSPPFRRGWHPAGTQLPTGMQTTLPPGNGHYQSKPLPPGQSRLALEALRPVAGPEETVSVQAADQAETQPRRFKVLAQLYNTYILLETVQGLLVVDQHIASERELFEAITKQIRSEIPSVQTLLASAPVSVTPTQLELLSANQDAFARLGFTYLLDSEALQYGQVVLTGVPVIYQEREPNRKPQALFEDLLSQLEETGEMTPDLDHLIATLACHSAVRAGDVLSHRDMERVVEGWLNCTLPWTCPHGRPIAHTIPKDQLNSFFHRPSLPGNAGV